MLIYLNFEIVPLCCVYACCPLNVVGYELNHGVQNVCSYKFVFVHCIKRLAHVQNYCYSVMLPWIVEAFCNLVEDVMQRSVYRVFIFESILRRNNWNFFCYL